DGMGPTILYQILLQSEIDADPDKGEGPLFIDLPSAGVAVGSADLSGAPTDYPMTIAEVFELLSSTGELDVLLTPIDSGVNMALINIYNGDAGRNLSGFTVTDKLGITHAPVGDVHFEYEQGAHNVRTVRMTEDSTAVCNKLWYYLGPRVATPGDPNKLQHWQT